MSKALFMADLHVKLGQKKVPKDWQRNRFMLLADAINAVEKDYIIIGGDLLDVANPKIEEIGLMYDFLDRLEGHKVLIPGNHELINKTTDCFIYIDNLLEQVSTKVIREFTTYDGIDYIPYNILHDKKWPEPQSKFAVTHVRGEIPPHVKPEIDLDRFNDYEKVFTGDLHSYTNCQRNLLYPGSPFSTSFHRSVPSGANGYFIIDTTDGSHEWVELKLPQLVRQTATSEQDMVAHDYHHVIYELEGELEDLAKVKNSDLLDKKVTKNISAPATLNLTGDIYDELAVYLKEVQGIENPANYITTLKEILGAED